ncbi:MAG: YicC/YloC family endoribonuclease [Parachlamydiaceae bacterium]
MLKSMTAYGRASLNTKVGHFVVEIQSVNRKFLDVNVTLPRELNQFDIELKKWLMPYLARGQVSVKVNVAFEGAVPFIVRPNLPLAHQLKDAWDQIAKELNIQSNPFNLSLLERVEGLLTYEENRDEEENYREALKQTLDIALKSFLQMKVQEGGVLQADISLRLEKMRYSLRTVEHKMPFATNKYREKLVARLEELAPGHVENEERILREIALFAEKIDITEELTRFNCHLTHLEELIHSPSISVGKTLEFVLQELNREINTIGSKSSDIEIARAVIDIKSELERIREQIQNIE